MGIVFRQSIKTTLVTFTGALLGLLLVYLSTQFLSKQELGFSRNLLNQAILSMQLVLIGMQNTLYVFIHKYSAHDQKRKVLISVCMFVPFLVLLIASIAYFIFKNDIIHLSQPQDIEMVSRYFAWLPLYSFLWSMMTLLEQYLASQMRVAVSSFVREVILRLLNILLVVLFAAELIDFNQFMISSILVQVIPIGIMYILALKTEGFGFTFQWTILSRTEMKAIADFAVFHLFLNVTYGFLLYIDSVMLAFLDKTGMEAAAVYFVALSVLSIYTLPGRAMASASTPVLNREFEQGNMHIVKDYFSRAAINMLIVTIGMAAIIICNLHNAVKILGEQYQSISLLIVIMMIGRTADAASGLNSEILGISKYYRFSFYLTFVLVICIVGMNFVLIPKYGVYGAAWSASLSLMMFNLVKLLFLWRKLQLQPFSKHTLTVLLSGAVIICIGWYIPHLSNPFADAFVRSTIIVVAYAVLLFLLKPSNDLNEYLVTAKNKRRLF